MIKSKQIDLICICAILLATALTCLLSLAAEKYEPVSSFPEYPSLLFDESRVHTVELQIEDWEAFIENAEAEAYIPCTAVIDGEEFRQVGLRAKGNNSLWLISDYGLCRYSLKLEFDHYLHQGNYYGLDKLSLDASFQDGSYMKTWLAYDMMAHMGVPVPLCSYVWVTVNGQPWGLYLAVEEPEDAFAERVFGKDHGQLYKPEYVSLNAENADIALRYTDNRPQSYEQIFRNAKFPVTAEDQERLIDALYTLSTGKNLESAVDIDQVLRYFSVQVFLLNWDSYLGRTGHNYFLYEKDGRISILPWDYNLAFGTYALGMTEPIRDPNILINYPVYTPAPGEVMLNRPLYHNLMKNNDYFSRYRAYLEQLIETYFESGLGEKRLHHTWEMISPYIQKDPTSFVTYEEALQAARTLLEVCRLRTESVRGQLDGAIPATMRGQSEAPGLGVDASALRLTDLGFFHHLEASRGRQDAALKRVISASG